MMRQPKDNYRETHQAVAARVLKNPLAQCVGYAGNTDRLQRNAAGEGDIDRWSFQSVEFHRAGTNCSLDVRAESVDHLGPHTDKEGNEWEVGAVRAELQRQLPVPRRQRSGDGDGPPEAVPGRGDARR